MPFPTEERYIRDAELKLGVSFPPSLRARLLVANGGEVEVDDDTWQLHPVFDATDRTRIKRTANHIVRETASAREWSGFPPDAVAIGNNGTGDRLVLQPSPNDPRSLGETVFFWDHETGELTEAAGSLGEL
jgi:hypothetical protein